MNKPMLCLGTQRDSKICRVTETARANSLIENALFCSE